jgi:hypothetical protein
MQGNAGGGAPGASSGARARGAPPPQRQRAATLLAAVRQLQDAQAQAIAAAMQAAALVVEELLDDDEGLGPCDVALALPGTLPSSVVAPLVCHVLQRSYERCLPGPRPQHPSAYKTRIKPHADDAYFRKMVRGRVGRGGEGRGTCRTPAALPPLPQQR